MPVYKSTSKNGVSWFVKFYYVDWCGIQRQKKKRGFKTKKEAAEFERIFLENHATDPSVTFDVVYSEFLASCKPAMKETTYAAKVYLAENMFCLYFRR